MIKVETFIEDLGFLEEYGFILRKSQTENIFDIIWTSHVSKTLEIKFIRERGFYEFSLKKAGREISFGEVTRDYLGVDTLNSDFYGDSGYANALNLLKSIIGKLVE